MSIFHIPNHQINKIKWDNCINRSINNNMYVYSDRLDLVAENWDALILGDYEAVMPLIYKQRFGIKYIYLAPFTQQTGIFSSTEIPENVFTLFINHIPQFFKYIDINFNYKNFTSEITLSKKKNFILYLNKPYLEMKKRFSENTKRNLKAVLKTNLLLTEAIRIEDAINVKTKNNINKLSKKEINLLKTTLHLADSTQNLKIIGVKNSKEKLISVACFIFSGNRSYLVLSASYPEGKNSRAMFLIINHFIKFHSESDLILDFEGSNIDGVSRFFESWGAINEPYYNFKQNRLPLFLRIFKS